MKILWLSSWYPNPVHPYDGDFIKRHARAVASYTPITVLYVAQFGESTSINKQSIFEQTTDGVTEKIIFFQYQKTGFKWLDKLLYNFRYYNAYRNAIKKYISENGKPDLVHVHIPMKAGITARWIMKRWEIPYILSEQSSQYDHSAPGNYFGRSFLHRRSVKKIFSDALAVTNVSAAVGNTLKNIFEIPAVKVIHNTVDANIFHNKNAAPARFRFIHVSTLTHQKNVGSMLSVVSRLAKARNDFDFILVGPLNPEVEIKIENESLQTVITSTGEIIYPDVAKQMQQASALVLFSRHENFPCVIIEALCCGLPCIAARVGGVEEAINESNGILVSKENEEELLLAMNKMIDIYYQFDREKIAAEAVNKYSYPVIGKQFFDLYKEILKRD